MSQENQEKTYTGRLGKEDFLKYKEIEKDGKQYQIFEGSFKPQEEDSSWLKIEAWNDKAQTIENGRKDGISKFSFSGKMVEKSYTNKEGEKKSFNVLRVSSVKKHLPLEIEGEIKKVEDKETSKGKPYKALFVVGGTQGEEKYNINVFDKADNPNNVPLEVGQKAAFAGEGTVLDYKNKEGNDVSSTYVTSWDINKDLPSLKDQVEKKKQDRLNRLDKASERVDKAIEDVQGVKPTKAAVLTSKDLNKSKEDLGEMFKVSPSGGMSM